MGKATVSRRIAGLEARLGVRLLRRSTRQVVPTEEGKRFLDRCVQLVSAARDATEVLVDAKKQPAGVLRVAAPTVFAQRHLVPAVVDFLARHADIQMQLLPKSAPVDLIADEIDVAIRIGNFSDSSFVSRRIANDKVVIVASGQYLRDHGMPQRIQDMEKHVSLRFSWEAENPRWRFRGRDGAGPLRLHGNLVASDATVVREAAMLGLGLAWLPSHIVADEVRAGRLTRVLESAPLPEMPIQVVYLERRQIPRRVRMFVVFIVERFSRPEWKERALLC